MTHSTTRIGRLSRGCATVMAATAIHMPAAAADPGRALVQQNCGSCHTLERGRGAAEGPNLFGVVGRPAGTSSGYAYSGGFLKALKGKAWTPASLDRWLQDTQKVAPGSSMNYFSDDPRERQAIVNYLKSLK